MNRNIAHSDIADTFRCPDQSTLANNYITSENPPPGAWSYHSPPQSPMGRTAFPEIVSFPVGLLYTRDGDRVLKEHHVTESSWVPWQLTCQGTAFTGARTVSKNCFFGRFRLNEGGPGLLLLQIAGASGVRLRPEWIGETGLRLHWNDRFEIEVEFSGGLRQRFGSDNPEAAKLFFADDPDIRLNPNSHAYHLAHAGQPAWLGAIFEADIELAIRIRKAGDTQAHFPVDFEAAAKEEEVRWRQFFAEDVPPLPFSDPVIQDTWHFAWMTLWANRCEGGTKMLPEPFVSPTRFHYGSQWWWDEVYHCGALRHLRPGAYHIYDSLNNFFRAQKPDGAIPGCLRFAAETAESEKELGFTPMEMQPPVIGFLLGLFKEQPGWPDGPQLENLYTALTRWGEWLATERDTDGDHLSHYVHSFDSTADQTPRWDSHKLNPNQVVGPMHPIESVDLNLWLSLMWRNLAEMATQLNRPDEASKAWKKSQNIFQSLEQLAWDEADGFYYDIDAVSHEKIRVKTPYGFMPLLHPDLPRARADRLIDEHLLNPEEFWCDWPLPSVALNDPAFDSRAMWRGPSWINVNWMVVYGLEQAGRPELAKTLARKTVELVGPRYDASGTRVRSPRIWEWFDPHTGEPLGNHHYGWSALVVDLILNYFYQEDAS